MERLKNLSSINTNTIEGRLLIAAMAKISTESQRDKEPDEILHQCQDLAEKIYKDATPLPSSGQQEQPDFQTALTTLINKYSMENSSSTPDFILSQYLNRCLYAYQDTVRARDNWFGADMWDDYDGGKKKKLSTP